MGVCLGPDPGRRGRGPRGPRPPNPGSLLVGAGLRLGAVALGLLVVGGWFFETLFRTGEPPVDLGDGWPIMVIAIGAVVVLLGLFGGPEGGDTPASS